MGTEVNELLRELRSAGLLESAGQFSIDFLKAARKLATRRLPDSRMYILRLVQSAVSGGSEKIEVEHSFKTLSLRGYGWTIPHQHLQELHSFLVKNSLEPALLPAQYLATAVNAALDQSPQRLHLVTWDGHQGRSLSFVDGQERFEEIHACPFHTRVAQVCFTIVHRQSWFFRALPELEWLRKQCTLSPVPITVNGRTVQPRFGEPRDLTTGKLYLPFTYVSSTRTVGGRDTKFHANRGFHLELGLLPPRLVDSPHELLCVGNLEAANSAFPAPKEPWPLLSGGYSDLTSTIPQPAGRIVQAAIGLRADLRKGATVRFVMHGVELEPLSLDTRQDGVEAVATGSGLATDLSGCRILEGQLQDRLRSLEILSDALWSAFLEKWGPGGPEECMAHALSGQPGSVYAHY